MKEEETFQPGD